MIKTRTQALVHANQSSSAAMVSTPTPAPAAAAAAAAAGDDALAAPAAPLRLYLLPAKIGASINASPFSVKLLALVRMAGIE